MTAAPTTGAAVARRADQPRFTSSRIEKSVVLLSLDPDRGRSEGLSDDEISYLDLLYRTGRQPIVRDLTWREKMRASTRWVRVLWGSAVALAGGTAMLAVLPPQVGAFGMTMGIVFGSMALSAIDGTEAPAGPAIEFATTDLHCREWRRAVDAAATVDAKVGASPELDALLAELHPVCERLQRLRNAAWDTFRTEDPTTPEAHRLEREARRLADKVQQLSFTILASVEEPHRWQETSSALANPGDLR